MRARVLFFFLSAAAWIPGARVSASEFEWHGIASGRGIWTRGQESWLEGGYGRLLEGADSPSDSSWLIRGQAHLGFDWKPSDAWLIHAHGVLQGEPSSAGKQRGGLVEAFLQFRAALSLRSALRFRAGTFFPQTSLENSDPLWQSPYTVTLSALNTWAAEEVRVTGLETSFTLGVAEDDHIELAGTVFGANDTSGTLLAWRGWTLGDRLTPVGERLPLPPVTTLQPGVAFGRFQEPGTRPVDELDNRVGWQVRARWTKPRVASLRLSYYDNRGDRELYHGQYSWRTNFATAGLELHLGPALTLLAEAAGGGTAMGVDVTQRAHVDTRFRVGYVLASWSRKAWRISARYDRFQNHDLDGVAEPDQESGWAWTTAVFWEPKHAVRLGVEYLDVRGARPAAEFSGADPNVNARRVVMELRLRH